MILLSTLRALSVIVGVSGSIGPNTNLYIANKNIQPDGFSRSYVFQTFLCRLYTHFISALYWLALPNEVSPSLALLLPDTRCFIILFEYEYYVTQRIKGDSFRLNVIDKLTDTTMLTSTSIVGVYMSSTPASRDD